MGLGVVAELLPAAAFAADVSPPIALYGDDWAAYSFAIIKDPQLLVFIKPIGFSEPIPYDFKCAT